ncbi:MAG: ubiquinol-cytochrome c reductase iron-sulfur subunit [Phycisphaerae bacterium]
MKRDPEQISTPPDGKPLSQQPAWRQDFPIDVPEDNYVARRDFTKFLVLTSGAFVVGQVCIGVKAALSHGTAASEARRIASLSDIPVGGTITFDYPAAHDSCILLRPDEKTLLAYSQKCTHLSCAVIPDPGRNCLHCPCHEGNFDLATGRAISGPPRRPLPKITLEVRGNDIYATGVEVHAA